MKLKNDADALALALYLAASAPSEKLESEAVRVANILSQKMTEAQLGDALVVAIELIAEDPNRLMPRRYEREPE